MQYLKKIMHSLTSQNYKIQIKVISGKMKLSIILLLTHNSEPRTKITGAHPGRKRVSIVI